MERNVLRRTVFLLLVPSMFLLSLFGLWYAGLDYEKADAEYASLGRFVELKTVLKEGDLMASDIVEFEVDWAGLETVNPDVVGWIVVPGTAIDYPIVKGLDNTTYLNRTFEGNVNACGTVFMDCRNSAGFDDENTILYGHNMRDGSMFSALNQYLYSDVFYKDHGTVWILTRQFQRKYRIFSVHSTVDQSESYTYHFPEGGYARHIAREVSASLYDGSTYDIRLPMITLSTCGQAGTDERTVVLAQPVYEIKISEE